MARPGSFWKQTTAVRITDQLWTLTHKTMKQRPRTIAMAAWPVGILCLVLLAVLLVHRSSARLDREQVAGSYRIKLPLLFDDTEAPATVELHPDGRIGTYGPKGRAIQEGTWSWDRSEGWVRSDVPELDRRIRGYLGWTGPKLFWRNQPGTVDLEEFTLQTMEP